MGRISFVKNSLLRFSFFLSSPCFSSSQCVVFSFSFFPLFQTEVIRRSLKHANLKVLFFFLSIFAFLYSLFFIFLFFFFQDFEIREVIGAGSFGKVVLCKYRVSNKLFCLKVCLVDNNY